MCVCVFCVIRFSFLFCFFHFIRFQRNEIWVLSFKIFIFLGFTIESYYLQHKNNNNILHKQNKATNYIDDFDVFFFRSVFFKFFYFLLLKLCVILNFSWMKCVCEKEIFMNLMKIGKIFGVFWCLGYTIVVLVFKSCFFFHFVLVIWA